MVFFFIYLIDVTVGNNNDKRRKKKKFISFDDLSHLSSRVRQIIHVPPVPPLALDPSPCRLFFKPGPSNKKQSTPAAVGAALVTLINLYGQKMKKNIK